MTTAAMTSDNFPDSSTPSSSTHPPGYRGSVHTTPGTTAPTTGQLAGSIADSMLPI